MKRHIFIAVLLAAFFAGCEDLTKDTVFTLTSGQSVDPAAKFLAELADPNIQTVTVTKSLYIGNVTIDYPKAVSIAAGCTVSAEALAVNADLMLNGAGIPINPSVLLSTGGGSGTGGIFKVRRGLTIPGGITLTLNEGAALAFGSNTDPENVQIDGVLQAASADSFYKIQVAGEAVTPFTLGGGGTVKIGGTETPPAAVTVQVVEVAADDDAGDDTGNNDNIFSDNEGDGTYDGDIAVEKTVTAKDFIFDFDGLGSTDTASLVKGKPAGILYLPKRGGPWTASLIAGWGNNASFTLEASDTPIASALIGDPDAYSAVRVLIEADTLQWGLYEVAVSMTNGTIVINKKLTISVLTTPPAPKDAPLLYPYIVGVGKNKLGVNWKGTLPSGVKGVKLYINTENNSANAALYKNYAAGSDEYTAAKDYITDLDGDDCEGGLPDGTTYYVWTRAYNDGGDGPFGPGRKATTSCTIPEMFYKDINDENSDGSYDFFAWDSYYGDTNGTGDMYIIHPPASNNRIYPGGLLNYGPIDGDGEMSGFRGDIVYFKIEQGYGAGSGNGKWGESLNGGYGGFFIIRYHDDYAKGSGHGTIYSWVNKRRYQAIYFYGFGIKQTVGPPVNHLGPGGNALGLEMGYFGNAYNLGGCNPEVDTFEQAYDTFGRGTTGYIAYIATPWYRNFKPEASGKDPSNYQIGAHDEQDYYYNEDGTTVTRDWSQTDIAKPGYENLLDKFSATTNSKNKL